MIYYVSVDNKIHELGDYDCLNKAQKAAELFIADESVDRVLLTEHTSLYKVGEFINSQWLLSELEDDTH